MKPTDEWINNVIHSYGRLQSSNKKRKHKVLTQATTRKNLRNIVLSESLSVVSNSLRPHGLYSPWNSPGRNTGVGSLPFSRGSSQLRDRTQVSHAAGRFFTSWAMKEAPHCIFYEHCLSFYQEHGNEAFSFPGRCLPLMVPIATHAPESCFCPFIDFRITSWEWWILTDQIPFSPG